MDQTLQVTNSSRAQARVRQEIVALLKQSLGSGVDSAAITVDYPPQPGMGDFSVACFGLAKALGKSPAEIARGLADEFTSQRAHHGAGRSLLREAKALGPYLNFWVDEGAYFAQLFSEIRRRGTKFGTSKIGRSKKVLVEYFSPNPNKPLTVGHVRNVTIGFTTSRLLKALGYKVIENTIYNDRGIALCKSIVAYRRWGTGATPKSANLKPDHFAGKWYVRFNVEAVKDPKLEEEARECLRRWEADDREVHSIWKKLVGWAIAGYKLTLRRLGVPHPRVQYFESDIYTHGKQVVLDGLKRGVFVKHAEGYVYAPLEQFGLPNKILLRSDGTSLYVTQDLYLAVLKSKQRADRSIYVVGSEQDLAFNQLFKMLELLGVPGTFYHQSYGMIRLPDGKIKSREGLPEGTAADDLLDKLDELALAEVTKRHPQLSAREAAKRGHVIALAALKYYILSVTPSSTMVFDPAKSLAFTGKTGPYLQYVHARTHSILAKARRPARRKLAASAANWSLLKGPAERQLALLLDRFPQVVSLAAEQLDPSLLARHLYDIASAFSTFYASVPVLQAEDAPTQTVRLALVDAVRAVMARGLALLGITAPKQM